VPDWAKQLVRLGSSFARLHGNSRNDILCLLVPIRSFAAVFLATGVVLEQLVKRVSSPEAHFAWLCSQSAGAVLVNGAREGVITGVEQRGDTSYLLIHELGNQKKVGPRLLPCAATLHWFPKHALRPDPASLTAQLAGHLTGESDQWFVRTDDEPCAVIIGNRKELIAEIGTHFQTERSQGSSESLEGLLRTNIYQYQMDHRRTRIESTRPKPSEIGKDYQERTVIFDGGRAYLNRARDLPGTDQIVVMEYGDPDLQSVVDRLNQLWVDRIDEDRAQQARLVSPPPGCELAHFQVDR
jgi:hypothetical protein